ncbi:MAG TPA: glutamate-cysteine ligase family protein [Planctomycetota bacterium]|nr:glutamate-cysteine ligase family protein [Planctomycetota bacterium]
MSEPARLRLFEAAGIELEYMLVDSATLSVLPAADELFLRATGSPASDVETGEIHWSNELVRHVVELKTARPEADLERLPALFQDSVRRINAILEPMGGRLMPSGMHPWMDPLAETRLWGGESSAIYEAFDRIFDCRGHGWSNVQSTHLNLPFAGDEEFARLHAAVRILLPVLPALAASSPIVDGRVAGYLDARMDAYVRNSLKVPSVGGDIVPEPVFHPREYRERILEPMYRDIAPKDPGGILQDEFLNARGAIARFSRGSIEIRVLDVQECPFADLAIAALVQGALRLLVEEHWSPLSEQEAWPVAPLREILGRCITAADEAPIGDRRYLGLFGLEDGLVTAGGLWRHLAREVFRAGAAREEAWRAPLDRILERGPLARRILTALGGDTRRESLARVYGRLCECLEAGELFIG